jgi:hypothetical protein
MGKSYTPTYRIEAVLNDSCLGVLYTWDSKRHGRPTVANLEQWRQATNRSFQPGGVNWHVSQSAGTVPHISAAKLVRQSNRAVVAEIKAPLFEVV